MVIVGHPVPEEEQRFVPGIDEELECLDPVRLADGDNLRDRRVLGKFYLTEVVVRSVVEPEEAFAEKVVLGLEVAVDQCFGASRRLCEVLGREPLLSVLCVGFDGCVQKCVLLAAPYRFNTGLCVRLFDIYMFERLLRKNGFSFVIGCKILAEGQYCHIHPQKTYAL